MKYQDKDKVQDNINGRSSYHGPQRRLAVPHGPQDTGADIVKSRCHQSEHEDQQIIMGRLADIIRHTKQAKQAGQIADEQSHDQQSDQASRPHGHCHCLFQAFFIFCPETLGNEHGKALGHACDPSHGRKTQPV